MAVRYEINTTPADGEVLLSETMSADWTALQVQIVPLNSSGGHEPLTSGSVSVMVSPFASGDFWIDINNNNYYGSGTATEGDQVPTPCWRCISESPGVAS